MPISYLFKIISTIKLNKQNIYNILFSYLMSNNKYKNIENLRLVPNS